MKQALLGKKSCYNHLLAKLDIEKYVGMSLKLFRKVGAGDFQG